MKTEKFAGWLLFFIVIGIALYWFVQAWFFVDAMMYDYNDVISRPDYK